MLKIIYILLALILSFSAASVIAQEKTEKKPVTENKHEINWLRFDEGLKIAKKENKHIFIDFTAKWCGWCRKMEQSTFIDSSVIKNMDENFIAVKVDADSFDELDIDGYKISERNLTRVEFGVTGFPTFWFLNPDGKKIGRMTGYQDVKNLNTALDQVKERKYEKPPETNIDTVSAK